MKNRPRFLVLDMDNLEREFKLHSRNYDSVLPPISTQTEENEPSLSNEQTASTPVFRPLSIE